MKTVRRILITASTLLLACTWAEAAARKKPAGVTVQQRVEKILAGVTLSEEQKAKLEDIKKEFVPKFDEVQKKADVITPEQKKEREAKRKELKATGKKGRELTQAVEAAVPLTDAQKAQVAEAKKARRVLEKQLRQKVLAILTPEQQDQLKKAHPPKHKSGK
jgi:Spy/CpxP family protein refolding chaperone